MKLELLAGVAAMSGVALLGAAGCGEQASSTADLPKPVNGVYSLEIQANTPSGLPKCTSALSGTVAYVSSPADLWACSGGSWCEIKCSSSSAGDVAYASSPQTLVACVSNAWTQVALPQGPKGVPGDAGPPGPQGLAGATGPQGDAGAVSLVLQTAAPASSCPNGGTEVQSGLDLNGDKQLESAEVTSISYVCNGSPGEAGAPGSQAQVTAEPPGSNCAAGGERIDLGVTVNGAFQVQKTAYVCNGVGLTDSDAGSPGATDAGSQGVSDGGTPDASDASAQTGEAGAPIASIPLSGCPGGGYWGEVVLGGNTPFQLLIDPESSTLAVASANCTNCSNAGGAPFVPNTPATDLNLTSSASYGDGSSWSGEVYEDTAAPGSGPSATVTMALAAITSQTSFVPSAPPCANVAGTYQGILGLGTKALVAPNTDAYLDKLVATGVPDIFSLEVCPQGGQLWLGGFDGAAATAPPVYTPMTSNPYDAITIDSLQIGGSVVGTASALGAPMVDLADTLSQVPQAVFNALLAALNTNSTFATLFPTSAFANGFCEPATVTQLNALPPLTLVMPATTGGTIALQLSAAQSYLYSVVQGSTTYYCPAIMASPNPTSLGVSLLRSQIVIYDRANGRLGLAPQSTCP